MEKLLLRFVTSSYLIQNVNKIFFYVSIGTNLPRNFESILNMTSSKPEFDFDASNTIDVLLNPTKRAFTANMTESKILNFKSVFARMDKKVALSSLFSILWYASLPCFDLEGITSTKDTEKALLKSCIWKGISKINLLKASIYL